MSERRARWQPGSSPTAAARRMHMLAAARGFFAEHGVLEVETPALSPAAASDPQIESVAVTLTAGGGRPYFLHTSPEFAMKRLLAAGWPDICQVCRVFRDGETGRRHQPEFTLIEWYRRGFTLDGMMRHTVAFIERVVAAERLPAAADYLAYSDAFRHALDLDPLTAPLDELIAASDADERLAKALGDDRDGWLDLLLTSRIVPGLARDRLTVIHHYPASQAALARHDPDDPRVAERFEIFAGEIELANGFRELTDASEQRARFESDQALRARRGLPRRPLDERFLEALDAGLPECAGVAIGFDRLVMLDLQVESLVEVQTYTAVEADTDDR